VHILDTPLLGTLLGSTAADRMQTGTTAATALGYYCAQEHNARYLLGCSSLTSQNPADGAAAFAAMQPNMAPVQYHTVPCPGYQLDMTVAAAKNFKAHKLLSAYLALGACICGPPALDRTFKTIDFLTLLDLQSPAIAQRRKWFGIE
jgi:putative hemolysin